MWLTSRTLFALGLVTLFFLGASRASELRVTGGPGCPPGPGMIEETILKEVVKQTCKYVTEMKKVRKTVYECKEEPYCLPRCSHCAFFGHKPGCGDCNKCGPPRTRKILVKREIVEEVPVCRCVVETTVEKVPVKVYRPAPACALPVTPPPR